MRLRFNTADEFALWVREENKKQKGIVPEIAANGVLVLLSVTCVLLDRQLAAQATAFQNEGGFTERLYKSRVASRNAK
jgi:four helix bundle suffix protein